MNSLQIDTNITFCPVNLVVSQPLSISNTSENQLAFKIKTNQKNLLSMYINHGFIKPFSTMSIPVKIVQKVDDSVSIKLQVNWCIATSQMKQKNDSKMTTAKKEQIFKKVFPINRKVQNSAQNINKSSISEQKSGTLFDSVYSSGSVQRQQKKITPFQYEKSQISSKQTTKSDIAYGYEANSKELSNRKQQPNKKEQSSKQLGYSPMKSKYASELSYQADYEQSNMEQTAGVVVKNLQTVSQQDEDDHEKQLQQIRTQQIQQKRKIDQIKVKIRKLNTSLKQKQIINPKILGLSIVSSFLFGGFLQYLLF